ncbi:MAG: hypothetical protein GDA46_07140 [Bdellovibrionales bacterium]|nr:hypothetical protein [Bdellovibrionales bacterium]
MKNKEPYFITATGGDKDVSVILDDDKKGKDIAKKLKKECMLGNEQELKIIMIDDCSGIEDIFSREDFKKYILPKKSKSFKDDSEKNSKYMKRLNVSKPLSAFKFFQKVNSENGIELKNLEKETQDRIRNLIEKIKKNLK